MTAYFDEVPAERKAALAKLRDLCCTLLKGFASQRHFVGLHILRLDVMNAHRDLLNGKGMSLGKGCIRYSKPERIDFTVVEMMLKATQQATGVICGQNAI